MRIVTIDHLSGAELDVTAGGGFSRDDTVGRPDNPTGGLILSPPTFALGIPDSLIFCETGDLIFAPTDSLVLPGGVIR